MSAADELAKLAPLGENAGGIMGAFAGFNDAAMADGALSAKTKELIALGVALTTQCEYCLKIHTEAARKAGATDAELAEVTFVAAALRAGAAVTHGANYLMPQK
ncbi:MAG: carboxymuconolactone decarboxylase family protein [Pseudomonadota bacterium]